MNNKLFISGWLANILGVYSLANQALGAAVLLYFIAAYCFIRLLFEGFEK